MFVSEIHNTKDKNDISKIFEDSDDGKKVISLRRYIFGFTFLLEEGLYQNGILFF